MAKKLPATPKSRRRKKTFFLLDEIIDQLQDTAERLDVPQSRVLEVLVRKHATALQMRVE